MQTYHVRLESPVFNSFRCQRAANSQDIDTKKKSVHDLKVETNIGDNYSVGLIVGASGSGKTTLAKHIFGEDIFNLSLNEDLPIIDQLPEHLTYEECAKTLSGIGLTSVPCWLRPVKTLSNGQRARAFAALAIHKSDTVVIDEWTSVVDRTVAKVMSHCVQKFARKNGRRFILLSCHHDVIEWLDPDWIIDCNQQKFIDRRLLCPSERERKEKHRFEVRHVDSSYWKLFSKYHYLSDKPIGGKVLHFGLFNNENIMGYNCLANYVPWVDKTKPMIMHVSRTVIHPDYAGMGLGILFDTAVAEYGHRQHGYKIVAKFSSEPFFKMMSKHPKWRFLGANRKIGFTKGRSGRALRGLKRKSLGIGETGFRENVKTYSFEYVP